MHLVEPVDFDETQILFLRMHSKQLLAHFLEKRTTFTRKVNRSVGNFKKTRITRLIFGMIEVFQNSLLKFVNQNCLRLR